MRANALSSLPDSSEMHATARRCDGEIVSNMPYVHKVWYMGMAQLICIIHNLWFVTESASCQDNEGSGGGM